MRFPTALFALAASAFVTVQAVPKLNFLNSLIAPTGNYGEVDLTRRDDISSPPTWDGSCAWTVPGVGKFTSRLYVANNTWSNSNFDNSTANRRYFIKSDVDRGFGYLRPSQVVVSSGRVSLTANAVPPTSTETRAIAGEMRTAWDDIQSGSVRTVAKGTLNPGAVFGMFFYGTTSWAFESDIEVRTSVPSNVSCTTHYFLYGDTKDPNRNREFRSDITFGSGDVSQWREYRMDWVAGSYVKYYVDNILVNTKTGGLPQGPGNWFWNSWSSSSGFSLGPSRQNNILTIGSVDLYVNRTGITCGTYSS